jgi:hypothetical protein
MASKTKKTVLFSILGLVLIAAVIGYKMYNKKHFSVESATPAATITAAVLHQTFATDTTLAKNKFIGDEVNHKVIEVTGQIADTKKDQQGNTIILLKTNTDGAFVNCTIEGKTNIVAAGNSITIKGICSGYNYDAEMGIPGDVILTRCVITK